MVLLNDWIKEGGKAIVRFCTSRINSDSRISVFAARENCLFEAKSVRISGFRELVPDLVCEVLVEQRALLIRLELWLGSQVRCALQVRASDDLLLRLLLGRLSLLVRARWFFFVEGHSCGLHLLLGRLLADLSDLRGHACVLEGLGRRTAALLGAGAHHATVLARCEACEVGLDVSSVSESFNDSLTF